MTKFILEIPTTTSLRVEKQPYWSASSLLEIEQCPKRFFLMRASYPSIWSQVGFPSKVSAAQIRGIVIHNVVSDIVRELGNCETDLNSCVVNILKKRGGYQELLKKHIEDVLLKSASNPRSAPHIEVIRETLTSEIGELRSQIQHILRKSIDRLQNVRKQTSHPVKYRKFGDSSSAKSVNSEFRIVDSEYGIEGYLDLLITSGDIHHIIDFKTGEKVVDDHWTQLQVYAWLWHRDRRNWRKGNCKIEVVMSRGSDESKIIEESEFSRIENEIQARLEEANRSRDSEDPTARPSVEICRFCNVKVLCEAYWTSGIEGVHRENWVDLRVRTLSNVGRNAWKVKVLSQNIEAILAFGVRDDGRIQPNEEYRILSAFMRMDEQLGHQIRLSEHSEVFRAMND